MTVKTILDTFEVVTARGAPIRQFDDLLRASRWAKSKEHAFPGIAVLRVTITQNEEREQVYRPRPRADDLAIPAIPERKSA